MCRFKQKSPAQFVKVADTVSILGLQWHRRLKIAVMRYHFERRQMRVRLLYNAIILHKS